MAETCIVCLGDLNFSGGDPHPSLSGEDGEPPGPLQGLGMDKQGAQPPTAAKSSGKATMTTEETVAHLLPCGHNLHNECLRPWVERANSCPICRASFNMVELVDAIGGKILHGFCVTENYTNVFSPSGPVVDSYPVQDKQQVAEIDPSMIVEEEDIQNDDPCIVCQEYGDEAELLICDGCDSMCHVFCAGLDSVPTGSWICENCMQNPQILGNFGRDIDSRARHSREQRRQRSQRRSRRQQSTRAARSSGSSDWARVWQSVWQRIHLDLDFPFDEEEEASEREMSQAQRRELQGWERRLRVAARQGAGDRFRQTALALLDQPIAQLRTPLQNPESQEEIRAWNAFDKAREAHEDTTTGNRRKRKSATASPSEPQTEPERALKRPRTRRTEVVEVNGESSASAERRSDSDLPLSRRRNRHPGPTTSRTTPGFLQSLLNEVETTAESPAPLDTQNQSGMPDLVPFGDRANSPQSSPGASPTASNYPTPRAGTPPPLALARPTSPSLLSSSVLPIYPPAPEFAPFSPADDDHSHKPRPIPRTTTHSSPKRRSPSNSPPPSKANSPTQLSSYGLSYSTKSEIQKMVKSALKPHYAIKEMSKDEFTNICRDVSRMLYERIANDKDGGIRDEIGRAKWHRVAISEVEKALAGLRIAHGETAQVDSNRNINGADGSSSGRDSSGDDADGGDALDERDGKGKERADESSKLNPVLGPTPVPKMTQEATATVVGAGGS